MNTKTKSLLLLMVIVIVIAMLAVHLITNKNAQEVAFADVDDGETLVDMAGGIDAGSNTGYLPTGWSTVEGSNATYVTQETYSSKSAYKWTIPAGGSCTRDTISYYY